MRSDELVVVKIVPCPLTVNEVCALLDASIELYDGQELRIDIRGAMRSVWTRERILLLDWHFLKSWSARFQVMGVFPLPFDDARQPWPAVRYLLYERWACRTAVQAAQPHRAR